jgi:hypothetical protein
VIISVRGEQLNRLEDLQHWQDVVNFEHDDYEDKYYSQHKPNIVAFVVVDGLEYKVASPFTDLMIDGTDPMIKKSDKIKLLDIKGLGLLRYRSRKVVSLGRQGGLAYYLLFDLQIGR